MSTRGDRSLQLPDRAELWGGEEWNPCVNTYDSSPHQTSGTNTMSQLGCEGKGRQSRECRCWRRDQQTVVCSLPFMWSQVWCFYQLRKCKYRDWSKQKNNCGGYSWEQSYLQPLPPSAGTSLLWRANLVKAKARDATQCGPNPGPSEVEGSFANGNMLCPFHPVFG